MAHFDRVDGARASYVASFVAFIAAHHAAEIDSAMYTDSALGADTKWSQQSPAKPGGDTGER